jgi:DNA-binding GntR family transcriptional regulator
MLSIYDTDAVTGHLDEYSETNISFHQAIISLSKCLLIAEITDRLFMHVRAIRARTIFEEDRAKRSIEDHLAIVDALEARDTERAERLVREHTLKLRDQVARHVELD